ncbi:uncharacterized protein K452DRAFT_235270 [Aplosporella prunicola CBS 121167]|uniref:C2H2-type domain-containing protein n=1 Tax=Aplosporella prunicola CBS 121167 TaxID=1176127 RepID=A0A6A6B349_9PEZI|nr:uncharacterized protein K452DRAFT_235270 [Aplosporella prunicola CBS 121167]KAF2137803.1 hypothetical protein K452DRAFT_235270 [Aplosporella prunicola CBS 121167]
MFSCNCGRHFYASRALEQHQRAKRHFVHASQFRCCDCERDFISERALEQHLTDKIHNIPQRRTSDRFCEQCNREFGSVRALEQHNSSLVHQPLSNIKCIGGRSGKRGCQRRFSSPSALLHHLESGACSSGLNRQKLNAAVQKNDIDRTITTGIEFTPATSTTGSDLLQSQILTLQSGNSNSSFPLSGSKACPFCPSSRPPFSTIASLNQHLSSPAHDPRVFHCPVSLFSSTEKSKAKSFSTLSGLTQHLESGVCGEGLGTLRKAAELLERKLYEMGMRKVKILK